MSLNWNELPDYKIEWNSKAETALLSALGDDLPDIREEVNQGISELFYFPERGYLVTRLENYHSSPSELVLVAAAGRNSWEVVRALVEFARDCVEPKIGALRCHAKDKGVALLAQYYGFEDASWVLRMEL